MLPYRVLPWPSTIPNAVAGLLWSSWVLLIGLQAYRMKVSAPVSLAQSSWLLILGWIILQTRFLPAAYPDGLIFPLCALALAWAIHTCTRTLTDESASIAIIWLAAALIAASFGTSALQLIQLTESSLLAGYVIPRPTDMQPFGNLAQRNQAAFVHIMGMVSLTFFFSRKSTSLTSIQLITWALMCLPMIAGLAMSASRLFSLLGGVVFCINALHLMNIVGLKLKANKTATSAFFPAILSTILYFALYAVFVILGNLVTPNTVEFDNVVERMGNVSNLTRIALQQQAWAMFLAHPLIGNGWGSFPAFALQWSDRSWLPLYSTHSHVLPTHWLSELGLIGLAVALPLTVLIWQVLRQPTQTNEAFLLKCLISCMLLYSLSEYPLWEGYFLFPFAFMLALLHRLQVHDAIAPSFHSGRKISPFIPLLLSSFILIGSAWSAHAYYKIHLIGQKVFTGQSISAEVFREIASMRSLFGFSSIMDVYLFASMPATPELLKEQINLGERVSGQYIDANILRQLGFLYILDNNQSSALRTFENLCRFYPEKCPELLNTIKDYSERSASTTANQVWADLNSWFTIRKR